MKKETAPKTVKKLPVKHVADEPVAPASKPAPSDKPSIKKDGIAYYLTLFKIVGHQTWRNHLAQHATAFKEAIGNTIQAEVTESKAYKIDRVTGEIAAIE